jgi:hypothetical protein
VEENVTYGEDGRRGFDLGTGGRTRAGEVLDRGLFLGF